MITLNINASNEEIVAATAAGLTIEYVLDLEDQDIDLDLL